METSQLSALGLPCAWTHPNDHHTAQRVRYICIGSQVAVQRFRTHIQPSNLFLASPKNGRRRTVFSDLVKTIVLWRHLADTAVQSLHQSHGDESSCDLCRTTVEHRGRVEVRCCYILLQSSHLSLRLFSLSFDFQGAVEHISGTSLRPL
jgi:hypothetical protein